MMRVRDSQYRIPNSQVSGPGGAGPGISLKEPEMEDGPVGPGFSLVAPISQEPGVASAFRRTRE
jgi:hypothetical protein